MSADLFRAILLDAGFMRVAWGFIRWDDNLHEEWFVRDCGAVFSVRYPNTAELHEVRSVRFN